MQICNQCNYTNGNDATFCNRCGGHLKGIQNPLIDRIIDKYKLTERIGGGGFGTVYKAHHLELHNPFAIKILHPHLLNDEQMVERFKREARVLAGLRHENIVQVIDFGNVDGLGFYLVMEWLAGHTLQWHIKEEGLPSYPVLIQIFDQLLDALDHAHSHGIVHRDLKPENLVLMPASRNRRTIKILDFGIARMVNDRGSSRITETGLAVGTPRYMAPEQAAGEIERVDHRADIYSVGVLLVEMLTGRQLFGGTTNEVLLHQIETPAPQLSELAPNIDYPPALEWVLQRALAKDPEKRFSSAREFADSLLAILEGEPVNVSRVNHSPHSFSASQAAPPMSGGLGSAPNSQQFNPHLPPRPIMVTPESIPGMTPPTLGLAPMAETRALPQQNSLPPMSLLTKNPAPPTSTGYRGEKHSGLLTPPEKETSPDNPEVHSSWFWAAIALLGGAGILLFFIILGTSDNNSNKMRALTQPHNRKNTLHRLPKRPLRGLPPKQLDLALPTHRSSVRKRPLPSPRRLVPVKAQIQPVPETLVRTEPTHPRSKPKRERKLRKSWRRRRRRRRRAKRRRRRRTPKRRKVSKRKINKRIKILFKSIPSGAKLSINFISRGRTPLRLSYSHGTKLIVQMEKKGYFFKKISIKVQKQRSYTIRLVKNIFSP